MLHDDHKVSAGTPPLDGAGKVSPASRSRPREEV